VNLVHGFVGLKDNFDLDGFERNRLAALVALVACCPTKAAP
jgi:telomere length regulation protein